MTNRDKAALLSAAVLAALVIVSAIIAFVRPGTSGTIDTASLILCCCIVTASILSIVIVYLTKVRRGRYEKLLETEYYRKYEVIRDTVTASQLSFTMKHEIRNDILDILLCAQKSGKSADSVVGNPETFAKDILRSYCKPGHLRIFELISAGIAFTAIVLCVYVLLWLEQTENSFFSVSIGVDMVFFFAFVALVVIPLTKRFLLTRIILAASIPIASGVAFVLTAEMLRHWFYDVAWVRVFLDDSIRLIPNPFVFTLFVLAIPLLLLIKTWLRKRVYA